MRTAVIPSMFLLACQPTTSASPETPETQTPRERAADSSKAEPWCGTPVTTLDAGEASLADLLLRTQLVATAKPSLDQADCSGIGHHHLAFSMGSDGENAVEAYRSFDLHGANQPRADYFLVGATVTPPRSVDLNGVCIPYVAAVSARIDWLLPLADANELQLWNERLTGGTCGRPGT